MLLDKIGEGNKALTKFTLQVQNTKPLYHTELREKFNSPDFPQAENRRGFDSRLNIRWCVLQLSLIGSILHPHLSVPAASTADQNRFQTVDPEQCGTFQIHFLHGPWQFLPSLFLRLAEFPGR